MKIQHLVFLIFASFAALALAGQAPSAPPPPPKKVCTCCGGKKVSGAKPGASGSSSSSEGDDQSGGEEEDPLVGKDKSGGHKGLAAVAILVAGLGALCYL